MRQTLLRTAGAVGAAIAFSSIAAFAQQGSSVPATYQPKTTYTAPRTPWGDPDLQGTYTNKDENGVPMERPDDLPAQEGLSEEAFHKIVAERLTRSRALAASIGGAAENPTGAGPAHWYETLDSQNHELWLITDPKDGKMPPLTPEGQRRVAAIRANRNRVLNNPEDHSLYDRCITRGVVGSMLPVIYGNSYEIVQAPGEVAIRYEMIHETRIIPLDGRPHAPADMRGYMGDARGHWEGSTLVIETTNFTDKTAIGVNGNGTPNSTSLTLVERFTPIDAKTLRWEVTVNDPKIWTRPWTFAMPLARDPSQAVFEYACHEGNYAMRDMLSAVRAEEKESRK
jgi:hypothetical protein